MRSKPKSYLFFSLLISIFILFYIWIMKYELFKERYHSAVPVSSQVDPTPLKIVQIKYRYQRKESFDEGQNNKNVSRQTVTDECNAGHSNKCVVLAAVCCGERHNETYTMIKSAIALTKSFLILEIFTEENLIPFFKSKESAWPEDIKRRVKLNLHLAKYPRNVDAKKWRSLFRECASLRLFLPSLLSEVDSLIYVDTDIVFMAPLEEFWAHFSRMNASHMAALTPEHEDPATGWYNRFAKHPYYGKLGVNSGVMLMNLTRLRSFGWEKYVDPIEKEFRSQLLWGDQDIINIIFHHHPDKLLLMGCEYNYRSDHCMYMNICKAVNQNGVFALHGSRNTFHSDKQPSFRAIYDSWEKFELNGDIRQDFYYPIERYFIKNVGKSNCGKLRKQFLKNIEKLIVL